MLLFFKLSFRRCKAPNSTKTLVESPLPIKAPYSIKRWLKGENKLVAFSFSELFSKFIVAPTQFLSNLYDERFSLREKAELESSESLFITLELLQIIQFFVAYLPDKACLFPENSSLNVRFSN